MTPPAGGTTEQALTHAGSHGTALVNGKGDILYLHGGIGQYLEPDGGEVGAGNILARARAGLKQGLALALQKAAAGEAPVAAPSLKILLRGGPVTVDLAVRPVAASASKALGEPLYLVILGAGPPSVAKEELQSVNVALAAANAQLQAKVSELLRANHDLNDQLAGTGFATIFVDAQQRVLRFTPAATRLIDLSPGDLNRPVGQIATRLAGYDRLAEDVKAVMATLKPLAIDVRSKDGFDFSLRIQPYRTQDDGVEGAVITFVDITDLKRTALELEAALSSLKAEEGKG